MGTIWVLPKNPGPNLQHQKVGGAQFIRPNLPGPDLPGPDLPGPDLPGPNLPQKIARAQFAGAQFATNKISGAQFAAIHYLSKFDDVSACLKHLILDLELVLIQGISISKFALQLNQKAWQLMSCL